MINSRHQIFCSYILEQHLRGIKKIGVAIKDGEMLEIEIKVKKIENGSKIKFMIIDELAYIPKKEKGN